MSRPPNPTAPSRSAGSAALSPPNISKASKSRCDAFPAKACACSWWARIARSTSLAGITLEQHPWSEATEAKLIAKCHVGNEPLAERRLEPVQERLQAHSVYGGRTGRPSPPPSGPIATWWSPKRPGCSPRATRSGIRRSTVCDRTMSSGDGSAGRLAGAARSCSRSKRSAGRLSELITRLADRRRLVIELDPSGKSSS